MFELQLLGQVDLRDGDGARRHSVLSQTKRFAVLAYLGSSPGPVARAELTGIFWPDLEDERARRALNQTVYQLRRCLAEELIVSVGERELTLDRGLVRCDVAEFESALRDDRPADAAAGYSGELLAGFHLPNERAFDDWLTRRRASLAKAAAHACLAAAQGAAVGGSLSDLTHWARRAAELAPYDEVLHRTVMTLLVDAGDRGGAAKLYEALVARLERELEVEPTAETRSAGARLRACDEPAHTPTGDAATTRATGPRVVGDPTDLDSTARRATATDDVRTPAGQGPANPERPRLLPVAALGGALVAAFIGLSLRAGIDERPVAGPRAASPSLAVLPFETPGGDDDDDAFAAGMHEETLHRIQLIGGLRLTSRTSVMNIRETFTDSPEIARSLGVRYLVEGSVMRAGDQVRVTVQLIDAEPDVHLWSGAWQRTIRVEDLFDIQSEIATSLAAALAVELTPLERDRLADYPTRSGPAHVAWSEGSRLSESPFHDDRRKAAAAAYRTALMHDPHYADAWARLARTRTMDFWLGEASAAEEARQALTRAQDLQPERPEVQMAGGDVAYYTERDYPRARRYYERVLELRPNDATAIAQIGALLVRMGDYEGGIRHLERSLALDPRSPYYANQLALVYRNLRDGESMRSMADRANLLEPDVDNYRLNALYAELCVRGDTIRAREHVESAEWATPRGEAVARGALALFRGDVSQALAFKSAVAPPARAFAFHVIDGAPEVGKAYALHLTGDKIRLDALADSVLSQLPDTTSTRRLLEGLYQPMHPGRLWSWRGMFEAFRGDPKAAVRWARAGVAALSYEEDARAHDTRRRDLFDTYTLIGDHDAALDELELLLGRPSPVGIGCLRLHPFYSALRSHPRFEEVLSGAGTSPSE